VPDDTPPALVDATLAAVTERALLPLCDAHGRWVRLGWGRWGEDRNLYQSDHFKPAGGAQPRTMHLGVDLEAPAGTAVHAPLRGMVHSVARNFAALDYGPTVILRHQLPVVGGGAGDGAGDGADGGVAFFTLYGHLSLDSVLHPVTGEWRWRPGDVVERGAVVGWVGDGDVNGGWPPHVHFQINCEAEHGGWVGDYPGVAAAADWPVYAALCPDPNALLMCPWV
jgi:peptidoglycan LD-endopeptidase LytH